MFFPLYYETIVVASVSSRTVLSPYDSPASRVRLGNSRHLGVASFPFAATAVPVGFEPTTQRLEDACLILSALGPFSVYTTITDVSTVSPSSAVSLIKTSESRSHSVTVRAHHPQVFTSVIRGVPVFVVDLQHCLARNRVYP